MGRRMAAVLAGVVLGLPVLAGCGPSESATPATGPSTAVPDLVSAADLGRTLSAATAQGGSARVRMTAGGSGTQTLVFTGVLRSGGDPVIRLSRRGDGRTWIVTPTTVYDQAAGGSGAWRATTRTTAGTSDANVLAQTLGRVATGDDVAALASAVPDLLFAVTTSATGTRYTAKLDRQQWLATYPAARKAEIEAWASRLGITGQQVTVDVDRAGRPLRQSFTVVPAEGATRVVEYSGWGAKVSIRVPGARD